jgi:hypothetical protein
MSFKDLPPTLRKGERYGFKRENNIVGDTLGDDGRFPKRRQRAKGHIIIIIIIAIIPTQYPSPAE